MGKFVGKHRYFTAKSGDVELCQIGNRFYFSIRGLVRLRLTRDEMHAFLMVLVEGSKKAVTHISKWPEIRAAAAAKRAESQ